MKRLLRILTAGCRVAQRMASMAASGCAAASLFGIMLLMLMDVAGRYLFNAPVPGAGEVIELAMGITVFAALPLVTVKGEHVRLDYLSRAVQGRGGGRMAALVEAVVVSISAAVMVLLAWRLMIKTETVWRYGDSTPFLNLPVAPVALLISACAAACAGIFLLQGARAWRQALVGQNDVAANKGQSS